MWTVSEDYEAIIATDGHWFETSVTFGDTDPDDGYKESDGLFSVSCEYKMFDSEQPTVGGCLASELSLTMKNPDVRIPRMSIVRPWVRVTDGENASEWIPQGVFMIDTRTITQNDDGRDILTIHAYDYMLKTEADYPSTSHEWPYTDIDVVREIANTIGAEVDDRTVGIIDKGYEIGLPAGFSMREVLSQIASMYGGNWVMNYSGGLLLIAMGGIPVETNYLIEEGYDSITFGGDRILV